MKQQKHWGLKLRSVGVAATVGALAFVSSVTPAAADAHTVVGSVEGLNPVDIDLNERGTVTVRKTESNPFDDNSEVSRSISGRELIVQRLGGVEINTTDGFAKAKAMTLVEAQKLPVEAKYVKTTDAEGVAVFEDLEPGLYVLGEAQPDNPSKPYYTTSPELFVLPVGNSTHWSYSFTLDTKDQLENNKPQPPGGDGSSAFIPLLIPIIIGGIALGSASSVAYAPPAAAPAPSPAPEPEPTPTLKKGIPKTDTPQQQPSQGPAFLPTTGANVTILLGVGVMMLLLGLVLVVALRPRKRSL